MLINFIVNLKGYDRFATLAKRTSLMEFEDDYDPGRSSLYLPKIEIIDEFNQIIFATK